MLEYLLQLLEEFYNYVIYKNSEFNNIDEILDQDTIFSIRPQTKEKPYFNEDIFKSLVEQGKAKQSDRKILQYNSGKIIQGISDIMKNPNKKTQVALFFELKNYLKSWKLSEEYINYLMDVYFKNKL